MTPKAPIKWDVKWYIDFDSCDEDTKKAAIEMAKEQMRCSTCRFHHIDTCLSKYTAQITDAPWGLILDEPNNYGCVYWEKKE